MNILFKNFVQIHFCNVPPGSNFTFAHLYVGFVTESKTTFLLGTTRCGEEMDILVGFLEYERKRSTLTDDVNDVSFVVITMVLLLSC